MEREREKHSEEAFKFMHFGGALLILGKKIMTTTWLNQFQITYRELAACASDTEIENVRAIKSGQT